MLIRLTATTSEAAGAVWKGQGILARQEKKL